MATALDRGLEHDQPVELTAVGTRRRGRSGRVGLYLTLIVISVFFILPLVVVVSASLKYRSEVFTDTGLIPATPGLDNHQGLCSGPASLPSWFANPPIVSIVGTVITLTITYLSA